MSGRFAAYNSEAVDVIMCGIPIRDGRAEEGFLTIEATKDQFEDEEGADGMVIRYATNSRLWKVTIKLKGSSKHNQQLSALHGADVAAQNGAVVAPYAFKDNNGATIMAGGQSWIAKHPGGTFGVKRGDVSWECRAVGLPLQMILGGN